MEKVKKVFSDDIQITSLKSIWTGRAHRSTLAHDQKKFDEATKELKDALGKQDVKHRAEISEKGSRNRSPLLNLRQTATKIIDGPQQCDFENTFF